MDRLLAAWCWAVLSWTAAVSLPQPALVPRLEEVTARLGADVPRLMSQAHVPGLAIAVIDNGRVAWTQGFGVMRAGAAAPVTATTRFEAASLSKPVTAFVALQLVDAGRLALDTPLTQYMKYADLPADLRAAAITARHVLSHTTGFANWRRRDPLTLFFAPGERFSYSGEGYVYLQRVIETITGDTLEAAARRLVFEPLGMARSSFINDGSDIASRHTDRGTPLELGPSPSTPNAAASLVTTAADYGRFVAAALGGERLKPATARMMLTPQVQLAGCIMCTSRAPGEPSRDLAWGLGWGLEESSVGRVAWHWGDNGGFKNYVAVSLPAKRGLVYFTNSDSGLALRDQLVARVLGGTHPASQLLDYAQLPPGVATDKHRKTRTENRASE
jgi:CubicO group peptidase (beta-lactamase class C family)